MSDESPTPSSNGYSIGTPTHTPSSTTETPPSVTRPSSSRAIVPTPIRTTFPSQAIATASSPTNDYATASPMGGGPTSTSYVVPPRPKPGRKPATDEPASKRKAQNRESQRAFRARKAAKVSELQQQVDSTDQKHRREVNDKIAELNRKDIQIRDLKALNVQLQEAERRAVQERNYWKDRSNHDQAQNALLLQELKSRGGSISAYAGAPFFTTTMLPTPRQDSPTRESISSFTTYDTPKAIDIGCGNCKSNGECLCMEDMAKMSTTTHAFMDAMSLGHSLPHTDVSTMTGLQAQTPPTDTVSIFADREIDFTTQFSSKRQRLDPHPSIAFLTQPQESDSSCGFCTDESNCLCRDQSLQELQDMDRNGDQITQVTLPPRERSRAMTKSKTAQNAGSATGPGSCDDCQANPRQRAWCQRVAQLRGSGSGSISSRSPRLSSLRNSSIGSALDPLAPRMKNTLVSDTERTKHSIGCSDAFKLLDGRVAMDNNKMDWIRNLNPVSTHATQGNTLPTLEPQRKYSALELDTAGVIATLQQSMTPLMPRISDGQNVGLIRIAQETKQNSTSHH